MQGATGATDFGSVHPFQIGDRTAILGRSGPGTQDCRLFDYPSASPSITVRNRGFLSRAFFSNGLPCPLATAPLCLSFGVPGACLRQRDLSLLFRQGRQVRRQVEVETIEEDDDGALVGSGRRRCCQVLYDPVTSQAQTRGFAPLAG